MGEKQNNVRTYLSPNFDFTDIKLPNLQEYKASPHYQEIFDIYKELGGILDEIPFGGLATRYMDFFINGKILELDEENHFNRYRLTTLRSSIYRENLSFDTDDYIYYCEKHSNKCRKDGGFWIKKSSEMQFGPSDPNGAFVEYGSSRYKQRAFYDMLKDYLPYIANIPLKRISIYDTIEFQGVETTVEKVLDNYDPKFKNDFQQFVKARLNLT